MTVHLLMTEYFTYMQEHSDLEELGFWAIAAEQKYVSFWAVPAEQKYISFWAVPAEQKYVSFAQLPMLS